MPVELAVGYQTSYVTVLPVSMKCVAFVQLVAPPTVTEVTVMEVLCS